MSWTELRTDLASAKECSHCRQVLGEELFAPSVWRKKGGWCKPCANEYYRGKRYAKAPGYSYKYVKRGRMMRRAALGKIKSERGCMFCGERHPAALDFHHRDPSEKSMNIARMVDQAAAMPRIMREVAKCDVVCANCHRKMHYRDGGVAFWPTESLTDVENQQEIESIVEQRGREFPVTLPIC